MPSEENVVRRVRNVKIRNIIFGAFVLAVLVALTLMLTVWSNPAPQSVLKNYLLAVTAGDEEQASALMLPGDTSLNTATVDSALLKARGLKLEDLKVKTTRTDQDSVKATLAGGWMTRENGGARLEIKESDNYSFKLLMHKGRWYMDPAGLFPL